MTQSGDGKTVLSGEETNFTAKRSKSGIDIVRSVQNKVAKYSVSGETCVELESHANTLVLGNDTNGISH